jgi:hypothetical protein
MRWSNIRQAYICDAFYFGLKDKIKDLLIEAGQPANLAMLKADTLKLTIGSWCNNMNAPQLVQLLPYFGQKPLRWKSMLCYTSSKKESTRTLNI